jgi:hypothetical protein
MLSDHAADPLFTFALRFPAQIASISYDCDAGDEDRYGVHSRHVLPNVATLKEWSDESKEGERCTEANLDGSIFR